jgi:Tfp pilus assembly protein PilV
MTATRHKTGFTLVETALALLAISLGLLGIFGLARHGLKASGDADEETRCAMLADTIFASLQAKNDELAAKKSSLYDWWFYWLRFMSGDAQVSIFLPNMVEFSESGEAIRIALGQHTMNEFLAPQTSVSEIKWNPTYNLVLDLDGINEGNLTQMQEAYERGQIDVTLTLHPGALLSGTEQRTFSTVLNYTGGLP